MNKENNEIRRKYQYEISQSLINDNKITSLSKKKKTTSKIENFSENKELSLELTNSIELKPGIIYTLPIKINIIENENDNPDLVPFTENCLQNSTIDTFKKNIEKEKKLEEELQNLLSQLKMAKEKSVAAFIQRNFLLIEQERLKIKYTSMQNLSILKHNFSQEKIQKILDKKEQIIQQEKLSEELKEKMQQRKIVIESNTKEKRNQIIIEENLFNDLNVKECDINSVEKSISNDIATLDSDIKKADLKLRKIQTSLQLLQNKKDEHNKNRIETLSHILTLKPYYKKFLILRKSKNNQIKKSFTIQKNRKNLIINVMDNYKFDIIISCLFNNYEQKKIKDGDDSKYISNELINMLLPYITQFSSFGNEEKNYFILYLSKIENPLKICDRIIQLIKSLMSHFTEMKFSIRVILKEITVNIVNENENFENEDYKAKLDNINQEVFGYIFCLRDEKNNSKFEICNLDYKSKGIGAILAKLSENNLAVKKKKVGNSTKTKTTPSNLTKFKDLSTVVHEINILNPFHSISILDTDENDIITGEVITILNELS